MKELIPYLLNVIIGLGILGGLSAFIAILSVWRQLRVFTKKPNPFDIDITGNRSPEDHAKDIRQQMESTNKVGANQQPMSDANKKSKPTLLMRWYAPQNLLHHRLEPMLIVAGAKEGKRRLPCIDDLHEWSRERELSRPCVSLHGLVVGSLLIIGILGTLVGVHTSMEGADSGEGQEILKRLLPALKPSMLAVGFTILLTIGKGLYATLLDQLLSKLDHYTLDTLIPALQTSDDYEDMDEDMSNSLQKANDVISHFDKITDGMCGTCDTMQTYAEGLIRAADEYQTVVGELASTKDDVESAYRSLAKIIDMQEKLSQELKLYFSEMDTDAQELHILSEKACTYMEHQGSSYEKTCSAMETENAALTSGLENLITDAHSFDGFEEAVNSMSQQITNGLAALRTQAAHMMQEVNTIRERACAIADQTTSTCRCLQGIHSAETQATDLLKNTIETTRGLTNRQRSYAESVATELITPLASSMKRNSDIQDSYVEAINEHSKKYSKSLTNLLHWWEWVALIVVIVTILSH